MDKQLRQIFWVLIGIAVLIIAVPVAALMLSDYRANSAKQRQSDIEHKQLRDDAIKSIGSRYAPDD